MKVAVIGSGLAGLTTAYLLRKEGIEVWLIEKSDKLGFHSQSIEIPITSNKGEAENFTRNDSTGVNTKNEKAKEKEKEEKWVVDVPMRGFQGGYYPLLLSLYHHLGIPLQTANYTFSFSSSIPSSTYFIHSGSSGYSWPSLPSRAYSNLFILIKDIGTWFGVAICYLMLVLLSFMGYHDLLPLCVTESSVTLREFTISLSTFLAYPFTIPYFNYTPWTPLGGLFQDFFIGKIVIPLFSSVGTMTTSDVWSLPVRIILEYIYLTLGTNHYQLSKGFSAASIADLLVGPVQKQGSDHVRLSTELSSLEYIAASQDSGDIGGSVKISMRKCDASDAETSEELLVDKVILATQASVAKYLLAGLEDSLGNTRQDTEKRRVSEMRAALHKIRYRKTIVVTHRDTSILPAPKDRRDINFLLPEISSSPYLQYLSNTQSSTDDQVPFFIPISGKVYTQATQIMQPPRNLVTKCRPEVVVLQTTNPALPIDPRKVLSVSKLERALPLKEPGKVLAFLRTNTPESCVYIVGSYAYPGIPLLEGCVGSAKLAVENIIRNTIPRPKPQFIRHRWHQEEVEPKKDIGGVNWEIGKGDKLQRWWRWRWIQTGWS
ncbi:uncharacterized protein L201_007052 [Kwoniella dendrophila CBS 6074]|uniref:Amine oxidase domain-containing protein n=1 Tax=Kwoniella dendrophila CBS 6074 TaxID=1295534 RepID=A0AAX4K5S6_9TREE